MEIASVSPVQFTPNARKELTRLMSDPGFDTSKYLRIGVKGGGCSGLSYVLGFDDRQTITTPKTVRGNQKPFHYIC